QGADDAAGGGDLQAGSGAGAAAVEPDLRSAARDEPGLAGAVDGDSAGDDRQGALQGDALHPAAGDAEVDGVGLGRSVGADDGLAQAAGARVVGVGDGEGGRGQPALQHLQPQAAPGAASG